MGYLAIVFAILSTQANAAWWLAITISLAIGCGILAVAQ